MAVAKHKLNTIKSGDTFDGAVFQLSVNGAALNLTGYGITLEFRRQAEAQGQPDLAMTISDGLSLVDAAAGRFQIDPQILPLRVGIWHYLVRFVSPTGRVKTWIEGMIEVAP